MVTFTTNLLQFGQQGEKTGWTYIEIPPDVSEELKPGNKKSFRVKGKLDNFAIKAVAVMPMGGGRFILPVNAAMRKGIGKKKGAMVKVQLQEDKKEIPLSAELMECLKDDPQALAYFQTLPRSHQQYFSKWIEGAKSEQTKTARLTRALIALGKKWNYGQMMRESKPDDKGWY